MNIYNFKLNHALRITSIDITYRIPDEMKHIHTCTICFFCKSDDLFSSNSWTVPELREITVNTKLLSEVTQFDNFYIRRQPVLDYRQSLQL